MFFRNYEIIEISQMQHCRLLERNVKSMKNNAQHFVGERIVKYLNENDRNLGNIKDLRTNLAKKCKINEKYLKNNNKLKTFLHAKNHKCNQKLWFSWTVPSDCEHFSRCDETTQTKILELVIILENAIKHTDIDVNYDTILLLRNDSNSSNTKK